MKFTSSSTARRRTASAPGRSFGGPQMPSPVRRIAPYPRRCTEISPPNEIFPALLAESSFLFMIVSKILLFELSDSHGLSNFPRRGSHELRSDRMGNRIAKDGVDRRKISFCQRPAADFLDGPELFRATCAPERDANTGLVEEPTNREMNHSLAKVLASVRVQFARGVQVLCELRLLELGIVGLAHVAFRKLPTCIHRAAQQSTAECSIGQRCDAPA